MSGSMRYRVNESKATHQTIDGEVIILSLERGHYYSLTGTAAEIWSGVERNLTTSQIAAELGASYDADRPRLEGAVQAFLDELGAEGLVLREPAPAPIERSSPPLAAGRSVGSRLVFAKPTLEKYTELEELLQLDPIHEVDEAGWPAAPRR